MTLVRRHRSSVFTCDDCGEEDEFPGEWHDALDDAKSEGWQPYLSGEDWEHRCPGCRHEGRW